MTWHDRHHRDPVPGFGAAIASYRTARGWSQSELARRTGLDHSYISRLESGDRPPPSRDVVARLAVGLELDSADRDVLFNAAGFVPPEHVLIEPLAMDVQRALQRPGLTAYERGVMERMVRAAVGGIEDIETEAA